MVSLSSVRSELAALASTPAPVPPSCLAQIRSLPGGSKCMDCGSKDDTSWASPSLGVLLCLTCGGRHRGLGVQVSFVRSLTMDNWNSDQVIAMLEGGNDQLRGFLLRQGVMKGNETFLEADKVYKTKAAKYYRKQIQVHVKAIVKGGVENYAGRGATKKPQSQHQPDESDESSDSSSPTPAPTPSTPPPPPPPPTDDIDALTLSSFKPEATPKTKGKTPLDDDGGDGGGCGGGGDGGDGREEGKSAPPPLPPSKPQTNTVDPTSTSREYSVTFPPGPMKVSLERRVDGACIVSRTVLGGFAHRSGVTVGSCLVAVGGIGSNPVYTTCAFDPSKSMGLSLTQAAGKQSEQTQVTAVVAGGQAERLGVQVGMVLAGVDGMGYMGHKHAVNTCRDRRKEGSFVLKFVR